VDSANCGSLERCDNNKEIEKQDLAAEVTGETRLSFGFWRAEAREV
jgi:hypothetical protein